MSILAERIARSVSLDSRVGLFERDGAPGRRHHQQPAPSDKAPDRLGAAGRNIAAKRVLDDFGHRHPALLGKFARALQGERGADIELAMVMPSHGAIITEKGLGG